MRSCNCHWKLLTWKPTRNLDNFYTSSEFESDMESDIGKVYTSFNFIGEVLGAPLVVSWPVR